MASETDIANMAFTKLGAEQITDIDEQSDRAIMARKLYPGVRDAVLRAHPWNCAITRKELSKLTAPPIFGYDNAFQLPTDPYCLRALETDDEDDQWAIEGRTLVTNNSSVKLKYVRRVTDPGSFDSLLLEAIVHRLACSMAYPVTGSVSKANAMWKLYTGIIREAWGVDGMEGRRPDTEANDLIDVR